jgi:hypothetical protein
MATNKQPLLKEPEAPIESSGEAATGPIIVYMSEEAKLVKFTINPKATKYVVRADGQILESM